MAQLIADRKDVDFVLHEQFRIDELGRHDRFADHIRRIAASQDAPWAFACPFLDVTGDVTMTWMLLWRAMISVTKTSAAPRKADASFYQGQIKSAEFFIRSVLPVTFGRMDAIMDTCPAATEISNESFGGL